MDEEGWIVSPDGTQRARRGADGIWEYQSKGGAAPSPDAAAPAPAPTQEAVPSTAPASPREALERRLANPPPKQPTPSTQEQTTIRNEGLQETLEKTEKIYEALTRAWTYNNRTDMGGTGMDLSIGGSAVNVGGMLGRNSLDAMAAQLGFGDLKPGFGRAHPRQRTFAQMRNDRVALRGAGVKLLAETMRSGERGTGATGTMLDSQAEFQNWMSMFPSPTNPNIVNRENTLSMVNDLNRLRKRLREQYGLDAPPLSQPGGLDDQLPPGARGEGTLPPPGHTDFVVTNTNPNPTQIGDDLNKLRLGFRYEEAGRPKPK